MTDYPPPPEQPDRSQQQPHQPPPPPQAAQPPLSDADGRTWAMLAHLSNILFAILGPLIIWLVFRERSAFVERQGKEALNFGITVFIAGLALGIVSVITLGIGSLLYIPLGIVALVFAILAGLATNRGEDYRYPVSLRLVK